LHSAGRVKLHRHCRYRKNARIVRSKSRVTKLFITSRAGVLVGAVHVGGLSLEGAAAVGGAMVKGGISHQSTSIEVQMSRFNPIHGKCAYPSGHS